MKIQNFMRKNLKSFTNSSLKYFTATTQKKVKVPASYLLSKEEKDLKFEDECFYFEKEWRKLQQDKLDKHQDYISKELSEHQKRECDILVETVRKFSNFETRYFEFVLKEYLDNTYGVEFGKQHVFRKKIQIDISKEDDNPNHANTQEVLTALLPFIASGYFSGGPGGVVPAEAKIEQKEEVKKEPEKKKANVDIKLVSFDAAKKINLIKEVRAFLNLGLKEAKEMVEKVPGVLKVGVPREEAEEIVKKLKDNGANIELV